MIMVMNPYSFIKKKWFPFAEAEMMRKWGKMPLPRPVRVHYVLEDFLTVWTAQQSHILPLRRFLEFVTKRDLRHHYAHSCLAYALTNGHPPPLCSQDGVHSIWSIHALKSPFANMSEEPEHFAPTKNSTSAVPASLRPPPATSVSAVSS